MPISSKKILTTHLLPFLALLARQADKTQMPPSNLALVFAPNLLQGPDPLEDARIAAALAPVLSEVIACWFDSEPSSQVEAAAHEKAFLKSLQPPSEENEWEDPSEFWSETDEQAERDIDDAARQTDGITLVDNADFTPGSSTDEDGLGSETDGESDLVANGRGPEREVSRRPRLPPRPSEGSETTIKPIARINTGAEELADEQGTRPEISFPLAVAAGSDRDDVRLPQREANFSNPKSPISPPSAGSVTRKPLPGSTSRAVSGSVADPLNALNPGPVETTKVIEGMPAQHSPLSMTDEATTIKRKPAPGSISSSTGTSTPAEHFSVPTSAGPVFERGEGGVVLLEGLEKRTL